MLATDFAEGKEPTALKFRSSLHFLPHGELSMEEVLYGGSSKLALSSVNSWIAHPSLYREIILGSTSGSVYLVYFFYRKHSCKILRFVGFSKMDGKIFYCCSYAMCLFL